MSGDNSTFVLTGRELTQDEQYILYGKPSNEAMTYFKSESFENLVTLLEEVYEGKSVTLPLAPKNNCMYLFYDLPVGTKHYFYDLNNTNNSTRNMIGETSLVEAKYLLNTFLLPKVIEGISKIDPVTPTDTIKSASDLYSIVGMHYLNLAEFFSAGLFVMTNGTQVVSVCSGLAKAKLEESTIGDANIAKVRTTHATFSPEAQSERLGWFNYCIPPDVQKRVVLPKEMQFSMHKMGSRYFEWNKHNFVVVSNKYLRLNGFVLNNDSPQAALTYSSSIAAVKPAGNSYEIEKAVNTLSSNIEQFIFTKRSSGFAGLTKLFSTGTVPGIECGYYAPKTSIICLNPDALEFIYKPWLGEVKCSEHISLGDGVLSELRESYIADTSGKNNEGYAKAEFKLNPEPLGIEADYTSSRYDIVKTLDFKLMFITKTSAAKDALKQARISRKITESCAPVINFVVNLFAARDFEYAGTNRSAAMITYSQSFSGYPTTTWASLPVEITSRYKILLSQFHSELSRNTASLATTAVNDLYTKFTESTLLGNFNGYPVMSVETRRGYSRENLKTQGTTIEQAATVFTYLFRDTAGKFNTPLFSPSSNLLQYMTLGGNMYFNSKWAKIPAPLANLVNTNNNYASLTGAQLNHFYPNNFISIDEGLDKAILAGKNNNWTNVYIQSIPITTCFNWSSEAIDAFAALKKCKTFTDYHAWYKGILPDINATITSTIAPNDEIQATTLATLTTAYAVILEAFAAVETPYLPVKVVKTRGRKKKVVATTTATDSDEEETDESETEGEISGDSITVTV